MSTDLIGPAWPSPEDRVRHGLPTPADPATCPDCGYALAAHHVDESGYDATILGGYTAARICPTEAEARAKYGDR